MKLVLGLASITAHFNAAVWPSMTLYGLKKPASGITSGLSKKKKRKWIYWKLFHSKFANFEVLHSHNFQRQSFFSQTKTKTNNIFFWFFARLTKKKVYKGINIRGYIMIKSYGRHLSKIFSFITSIGFLYIGKLYMPEKATFIICC